MAPTMYQSSKDDYRADKGEKGGDGRAQQRRPR